MTLDPYRLALSVTHADGRSTRWGGDELNSQDVPTGLTFSTSIPGGFKDLSCSLMRHIDRDYADEALFDDVRLYGPGNETAWEGRMVQFPRQHADQFSVQPGAVGWSVHLRDDPSFREIYVDRDMSHWGEPSLQRKLDLLGTYADNGSGTLIPDPTVGFPALDHAWTRIAAPPNTITQSWYDGGGIPLGRVYVDWTSYNIGVTAALWSVQIVLSTDDRHTTIDLLTINSAVTAGVFGFNTSASNRLFATLQSYYFGTFTGDGDWHSWWRKVVVYGNHGLIRRGSEPTGYYASDVVANIVSRAAPLLRYTTGTEGSISPTTFVIPHLAFTDPVTAEDAISLVNGYHLYEWGVYDNREFFWRQPNPGRVTWEARLSDGAQVSLEGDDANNIFNGVFVSYTDPTGKKKTVGPPGSIADATDTTLVDTSTDNPVNAHGIPRRWGRLDVTNTTTQAGAIQLGAVWLAEHNLPARRGQLTLTGLVQHPTQGKRPVWAVRAGDYIRIADRPNDPVRRIIETSYDHDSRKLTASLDQTVFKLEALLERMGVNLIGVV